jgi:HD-GYP domain-containing protein (c-di-GMP phosphodiesterase class II)
LHDIGKICIDDSILRKPGELDAREFEIMKTHTTKGAEMLERVPELVPVIPIVRSHHERWDGTGYPDGLKGENIPRLARIVAVADGFDALTFDTPYRRAIPVEEAFAELEKQQGAQFDPQVVTAFLQVREKVVEEMSRLENKSDLS